MQLHELYPFPEERKSRKRIGRGGASGQGGTAGKGHKGQNARAGGGVPAGFEGGQMPLQRRLPKHGFKNPFKITYEVVSLERLANAFPGKDEISVDDIYARGLARTDSPVKILADGELSRPLKVEAHKFSASALEKIAQAGGNAKILESVEISLQDLAAAFKGQSTVTLADIYGKGLVPEGRLVRILGAGKLRSAVTIEAHNFSASALAKIAKASGTAKVMEG